MGGDFQRIDRQLQGIPVDFRACLLGETRQRMFLQPGQIVRAARFRSGARYPFAAERQRADNRADLVAVDINIAHLQSPDEMLHAVVDAVWDGLANISLALEDHRIDWSSNGVENHPVWRMAAGVFLENYLLAVAIKSSGDSIRPLSFKLRRVGSYRQASDGFEPAFSS